jgi:hypothetical protein
MTFNRLPRATSNAVYRLVTCLDVTRKRHVGTYPRIRGSLRIRVPAVTSQQSHFNRDDRRVLCSPSEGTSGQTAGAHRGQTSEKHSSKCSRPEIPETVPAPKPLGCFLNCKNLLLSWWTGDLFSLGVEPHATRHTPHVSRHVSCHTCLN